MLNPWMCNAFHSHANGPGFVSTSTGNDQRLRDDHYQQYESD